ncbi:acetyl-CoA C-acyltransferase [Occultella glacieicola]|uniref:Probable acetyl-CoA acetyltransferase n=1 Tax=Occultella glacieicola TaxID=2518684 RepID=A0ABY2DZ10_9MICO|nr:acetyl-CoA C-acyltransferase [Occultella glacieicola]TDE89929.1 acetyl-CoA C-acyltransferase [Occultella glacieicola]
MPTSPDDVVIVGAARTPYGRINGGLASLPGTALGAHAIAAALAAAGVSGADVEAVVLGQVLQAGAGQNPARQAALAAGIAPSAHAIALNKVCLSGLTAIIDAARLIRTGEATVAVAGGMESMSQAPHLLPGTRAGWVYGDRTAVDHLAHDGLTDAVDGDAMGALTERGNATLGLTRAEQDALAARSHRLAVAARADGVFAAEIAPVTIRGRKGEVVVDADEGVRPDTTEEVLARLRPAFADDGTITAGNSSQLTDGAAAVVLTSRAEAERHGLGALAVVDAAGQVAGPDNSLHSQPARAIAAALTRAGWTVSDLDLVEINEAFAAVVCRSQAELGVDPERVNIHGGAIALGHPIGSSGARLVVHAAHELARRGSGRAAVGLCGGGGQGEALLLRA